MFKIPQKYYEQVKKFYDFTFKEKPWVIPVVLIILFSFYWILDKPPVNFPIKTLVKIEKGASLAEVSNKFEDLSIIENPIFFQSMVILLGGEKKVMAGDYFFNEKLSALDVARKVTQGKFGLVPIAVVVPEGSTIFDIANQFEKKFPEFNKDEFIKIAKEKEGYLFPDTYLFLPNVKAPQVVEELSINFENRINSIKGDISNSGRDLKDIITMASILEKEARTKETKEIIAGILWKRIKIGMPLQVDAVFPYINGKNTFELTLKDLRIDSPYNTYRYKGLPIGPIANPSLESILATINPIDSSYLFYLSDKNGKMYYAENYKKHLKNKRLYLDR